MKFQKSEHLGNEAAANYVVFPGFPPIDNRVRVISPLKGSWYEMGVSYGVEAGDLIRWVFDGWWINAKQILEAFGRFHVVEDLHRYEESIFYFGPQLLDFLKGIANGASEQLSLSPFKDQCTHYEKLLLINVCTSLIWNHPPLFRHADHGVVEISRKICGGREPISLKNDGCSHFAIVGEHGGAKGGKTFHAHSRETEFCPWNYNVFFVAIPNEMGARPWWTLAMAGQLAGNMVGNISGLSIGTSAGAIPPMDETPSNERAFGTPISCFRAWAGAYAATLSEGVNLLTLGTENYRNSTHRKTLLRDFGNNVLFADKNECIVIETTACRYGIRKPGENGEAGNYIAATNHQYCNESFDEDNTKTNTPMTCFGNESTNPTSAARFWSLMWMIKNHFGMIDESLIMNDFMAPHFFYDKEGRIHDTYGLDPFGEIPAHHAGATVCRHLAGFPDPFTGGSNDVKLFALNDNRVYFVQGRPCEWHGPWDYIELV